MNDRDPSQSPLLDDDALLAELRRTLDAVEPVPVDAITAATSAFDLGRADLELADLVFDSLLDDGAVAMRHAGVQEARSLGFLSQGYRLDVELLDDDSVLLGQIEPAEMGVVELETADGPRHGEVDELGRFRFDVPRGSLRLRITMPSGAVVATPWITW